MPVIGITSSIDFNLQTHWLGLKYIEAVRAAGGLPLILPNLPANKILEVLKVVNGIILSGGGDVDPFYLGEDPHPYLGEVDPKRDEFELSLVKEVLKTNMPLLGICRGAQVLALAAGGKMEQHLYNKNGKNIQHMQKAPRWHSSHNVKVKKNTLLYSIIKKEEIMVNSFHHQGMFVVPSGFQVSASSSDGVVEALESRSHDFVVGVQWHPEALVETKEENLDIFKRFVEECR